MNHDICYEKYSKTKERNKICDKKMLDNIKSNKKKLVRFMNGLCVEVLRI